MGCGIKIVLPSPPNYVTRSPGCISRNKWVYIVKLHSYSASCYLENILKDQLSKTSRWQFHKWLFGPEKVVRSFVKRAPGVRLYTMNDHMSNLNRYQFNPAYHQTTVTMQILLKALMMLPNADFIMCRCLIDDANVSFMNK